MDDVLESTVDAAAAQHECDICSRTMSSELVSVCSNRHRCCKECIARIVDNATEGGAERAQCPFCRTPVAVDASSVLCSYCHVFVSSIHGPRPPHTVPGAQDTMNGQPLCTFCATLPRTNVYEDAVCIGMRFTFFAEKISSLADKRVDEGYHRLLQHVPLTDVAFTALIETLTAGPAADLGPVPVESLLMALHGLRAQFTLAQANVLAAIVSVDAGGPLDQTVHTCIATRCIEFLSVGPSLRMTDALREVLDRLQCQANPLTPGSLALAAEEWYRFIGVLHRQLAIA